MLKNLMAAKQPEKMAVISAPICVVNPSLLLTANVAMKTE